MLPDYKTTRKRKTKIEVQIPFFMSYENVRLKNGNDNCNSVFQSNGKTKNENTSWNSIFNVVGKRKTKMESRISDGVGKRKTKLEVRIPFSHVVGKRLALRYTHSWVPSDACGRANLI